MQLSGVMVALATPVGDDGALDHAALEALVHRVVAGGVQGISPVGTTGEGASLSLDDRLAIVDTVRRCAPDRHANHPGDLRGDGGRCHCRDRSLCRSRCHGRLGSAASLLRAARRKNCCGSSRSWRPDPPCRS